MSEHALADASAALQKIQAGRYREPLHGVPIAIKDLCYTQGVRTMGGAAILKNFFVPAFDSTVVAKLLTSGAVVLGKLNLSEGPQPGTTLRSMSRSTCRGIAVIWIVRWREQANALKEPIVAEAGGSI